MKEVKNICAYCGDIINNIYEAGWVVGQKGVYHSSCSKIVAQNNELIKEQEFCVKYTKNIFNLLKQDKSIEILSISGYSDEDTIITYKTL